MTIGNTALGLGTLREAVKKAARKAIGHEPAPGDTESEAVLRAVLEELRGRPESEGLMLEAQRVGIHAILREEFCPLGCA